MNAMELFFVLFVYSMCDFLSFVRIQQIRMKSGTTVQNMQQKKNSNASFISRKKENIKSMFNIVPNRFYLSGFFARHRHKDLFDDSGFYHTYNEHKH